MRSKLPVPNLQFRALTLRSASVTAGQPGGPVYEELITLDGDNIRTLNGDILQARKP